MGIPKSAFSVAVNYRVGDKLQRLVRNFESLDAAHQYSALAIRKHETKRVQVCRVIDEVSINGGVQCDEQHLPRQ